MQNNSKNDHRIVSAIPLTKILPEFKPSIQACDSFVPDKESAEHPKENNKKKMKQNLVWLQFPTKYLSSH